VTAVLVAVALAAGVLALLQAEQVRAGFLCVKYSASFDPLFRGSCYEFNNHEGAAHVAGYVIVDDEYAPDGTAVEAVSNGVVCGSDTFGPARLDFYVLGKAEKEGCGQPGELIEFRIDGTLAAQTIRYPELTNYFPYDLLLTVMPNHAWYWFERISVPAPKVGTKIEAVVAGTVCGEGTLGGEDDVGGFIVPPNIRGFSRLIVPRSDLQPGCAQNGSIVEFRVGGLRAETAVVWQPGVQRLDLLVQGDATCDFLVDPRDATLVLQHIARLVADVACHGDADRDHDLDAIDARHILEFAAGITTALPL
jgi:hypothetical protein